MSRRKTKPEALELVHLDKGPMQGTNAAAQSRKPSAVPTGGHVPSRTGMNYQAMLNSALLLSGVALGTYAATRITRQLIDARYGMELEVDVSRRTVRLSAMPVPTPALLNQSASRRR